MSCKCCAGPCRKKAVKKRGGKKPKKAPKQPAVSITLGQPQAMYIPRIAPTFQSSINTPLSEQKVGSPMIKVPSRIPGIGREIETQSMNPERASTGFQTVQLAGGSKHEEMKEMSLYALPGETRSDFRIRTFNAINRDV